MKNVIRFADQHGSAVVHISTLSVGGYAGEQQIQAGMSLDEASLYVGQKITNAYILSKYHAEFLLLQAAANGLPVKIMRVGNLQGRLSDGEFQMNLRSNAFARMLKSYALLKSAPFRLKTAGVNFSPVDDTAKSIFLLAGSHERYTVFHTFNPNSVKFSDIFEAMNEAGYQVEWMPDLEFEEMVERLAQEEENQSIVEGILLEQPDIHLREVPCSGFLTASVLSGYGFSWGEITHDYLQKYFDVLDGLGLFDA
jgi:thioester reductase-like protein